MEIYKFKTMTGVNGEALYTAFQKLLYNEQMKHPSFDYDKYEWVIGCDVFERLRQTTDWHSYSASDEIDKYLGIDLKVFSPGLMSTTIFLDKKNSEGITPYKRYLNSIYGTKMFEMEDKMMDRIDAMRYVVNDIISLNNAYNNMFKKDTPKKVIFNDPATIVYWKDGTKTVVKAEGEPFDPEKGLVMAVSKKHLGNEGNYYDIFRKWLPKEKVPEEQHLEKADNSTHITRSFDILTADEFAERVNGSLPAIIAACEVGVYPGARKVMGEWLIPYLKTSEV